MINNELHFFTFIEKKRQYTAFYLCCLPWNPYLLYAFTHCCHEKWYMCNLISLENVLIPLHVCHTVINSNEQFKQGHTSHSDPAPHSLHPVSKSGFTNARLLSPQENFTSQMHCINHFRGSEPHSDQNDQCPFPLSLFLSPWRLSSFTFPECKTLPTCPFV